MTDTFIKRKLQRLQGQTTKKVWSEELIKERIAHHLEDGGTLRQFLDGLSAWRGKQEDVDWAWLCWHKSIDAAYGTLIPDLKRLQLDELMAWCDTFNELLLESPFIERKYIDALETLTEEPKSYEGLFDD